jgi:thioredoxin-related protein
MSFYHSELSPAIIRMSRNLPAFVSVLVFSSCAFLDKKKEPEKPFGETGIPPALRAKATESGTEIIPGGNTAAIPKNFRITPDEDMIFTDPDNPDAVLPELASVLSSAPAKRAPWEESETIAKKLAAREGKPLMIWFTDTKNSPMCRALNDELFSTAEFEDWANEKIIRLRVDSNINAAPRDPNLNLDAAETRRIDIANYAETLKKRYRALGHPTVVMLDSSGAVLTRYRGYKRGDAQWFFGKIKHSEAVAANAYQNRRKSLENKGYRDWSDKKGRKFFAKLAAYSKGTLILIEPDGSRARTYEDKLSDEDRKWIEEQKRLRGIQ